MCAAIWEAVVLCPAEIRKPTIDLYFKDNQAMIYKAIHSGGHFYKPRK